MFRRVRSVPEVSGIEGSKEATAIENVNIHTEQHRNSTP